MNLRHSKTLNLIAIAVLVVLGEFAVELLVPDVQKIVESNPLMKPLLWVILGICIGISAFREHQESTGAVHGTNDATFATEADQANRRAMLGLVRRYWIEGVLHKSLWNEVRLILNLEGRPDAVVHPCGLARLRAGRQPETQIEPGTSILDVYRQEQGQMLLLGEPGSGKTTLLLEIAEALLQEAENDTELPIPVVFELSAWRKKHTRFDAWLVEQLNQDYLIPEKIGKCWVESGALLLLLDGLDEVAPRRRAACVEAINVYRLQHQSVLRPIVVCCRTHEYEKIPDLRLNGGVVIHRLTRRQVDDYLKGGGRRLAGLQMVLRDEPALYEELFATPLMFHVAVVTYEGQKATELRRSVPPEERRRRLWDAYIERAFERKQEEDPQYKKALALEWLEWLGNYLTRKHLQKYLLEGMQPDDLPRLWQTFIVRWIVAILLVSIFLIFLFKEVGSLGRMSILSVTSCLLLGVWIGYSRDIQLQPMRRFTMPNLRHTWKTILTNAVLGAALGAALSWVPPPMPGVWRSQVLGFWIYTAVVGMHSAWNNRHAAMAGMALSAALGAAVGGAVGGARALFQESVLKDTVRPNQSIRHSLLTAAIAAAIAATVVWAIAATLYSWRVNMGLLWNIQLFERATVLRVIRTFVVAAAGPLVVVIAAAFNGGRTVLQHYLLRLLLWRSGRFPYNITPFLDWADQRALVQRVGGGWRFVHRTLQERFAERYYEKYPDEQKASSLAEK
jgi:hypothetical protein